MAASAPLPNPTNRRFAAGHVTLTGVVTSEIERRYAEVLAREVFGVFSVENKLRIES